MASFAETTELENWCAIQPPGRENNKSNCCSVAERIIPHLIKWKVCLRENWGNLKMFKPSKNRVTDFKKISVAFS